ncbi:MAG: cysteine--tRNA ligase [Candidatus Gracilibacteria bacterium]
MKIYNTFSKKKEKFVPIKKGEVSMYVCGPTVYDVAHLGHGRAAVSMDLIRRYLEYKGFKVTFVSNITDVDDKIIKRAAQAGISEKELAEKIIPEYEKDYAALNVLPPTNRPLATQYIKEMVKLVETLMEKGFAYKTSDGVYFEVSKFKEYGKLSGQKLDELQSGARIAVDDKKKSPLDFALWKATKEGEPSWDGPLGVSGRPGWHIECSAMSKTLLGETFDIHGGGADLIFPHHECEIAQSEAANGKQFVRFWVHNGHVMVNSEKMSKSLGNFTTLQEIFKKYNPLIVRYLLISTHYRQPLNFTPEVLDQAKNSLQRIHDFARGLKNGYENLPEEIDGKKKTVDANHEKKDFEEMMDNDFEVSGALSIVFNLINSVNGLKSTGKLTKKDVDEADKFLQDIDAVLGLIFVKEKALPADVEALIAARNEARNNREFKRSDEIRAELESKGIILEDTKNGTTWKHSL